MMKLGTAAEQRRRSQMLIEIEFERRRRAKQLELAPVIEAARNNYADYVRYVRPKFVWNWHHEVICHYLDLWVKREIRRLMFFLPPRHSKSELVSRILPGYIFGRNPDVDVVLASYASTLADEMNRDTQRIMESEEHKTIFPEAQISDGVVRRGANYQRNSHKFEIVSRRGVYRSVGVRGSLTGSGFHYGIIDDPVKDHVEALSKNIRDQNKNWYDSVFSTRMQEEDSCILLTMTRWHEDDLAGRLLSDTKDEFVRDNFTVVELPAFCTNPNSPEERRVLGEALWPQKFSEDFLIKRRNGAPAIFDALYQQNPKPEQSRVFRDPAFYDELWESYTLVAGIDLAYTKGTKSNKSAFWCAAVKGDENRVLYVEQWKEDITVTIERLKALQKRFPVAFGNENNGPQIAINDMLQANGVRIHRLPRTKDKLSMAQPLALSWNNGKTQLPRQAVWLNEYLEQMTSFTGIGDEDDDMVDGSINGFLTIRKQGVLKV
jgi:hypothetical protein